jgi:hypothetical protein
MDFLRRVQAPVLGRRAPALWRRPSRGRLTTQWWWPVQGRRRCG